MNFTLHQYKVGALRTNCYMVVDEEKERALVVDPGDEGDMLSEKLVEKNLELTHILLTHGHFDHVGGLLALKLNWPQAKIYLSSKDEKIYRRARESAEFWGVAELDPPPKAEIDLAGEKEVEFGTTSWQVIPTPGHTPGSVSFYNQELALLFAGDTLFNNEIGRTDFRYSSKEEMRSSLQELLKLPEETVVLPGHGRASTIGTERINLRERLGLRA